VLVDEERQRAILERVKAYLDKKCQVEAVEERHLAPSRIGRLHYLPVGIEEERGFMHKVFDIIEAHRKRGYRTPILVVSHRKNVVVDGYARAVAAYLMKVAWKAYVVKCRRRPSFFQIVKKDIGRLYKRYMNTVFLEWGERSRG